jgi:hypothetical protein
VVWQGSAGDCRPYADQTPIAPAILNPRLIDEGRIQAHLDEEVRATV